MMIKNSGIATADYGEAMDRLMSIDWGSDNAGA
jgi:hypothetical protein